MHITDTSRLSLVDLTKRGLEAHLQEVVLEKIVQEQLAIFEQRLRLSLVRHVKSITVGHVEHVTDVLKIRDEMRVHVDVDLQDGVANGCAEVAE